MNTIGMKTSWMAVAGLFLVASGCSGSDGSTGPQGPQGPIGPQGIQGAAGPQGIQGDPGPQGAQGIQGIQGDPGPQGAQGIQGIQGATGPQGIQGVAGPAGPQGSSLVWRGPFDPAAAYAARDAVSSGGASYIALVDMAAGTATAPPGPQWDLIADVGAQGPQGIQGATGPQGIQGVAGPTGPQGIQGDPGPQGPQGIQGLTGPTGATGPQGIQGVAGPTGPQGPQGPPALVSATTATGDASTPGTTIPQAAGICDGQNGVALFGAPASIILGANQVMTVSGTANIGGSVAVSNLSLNLCYQPVGGAISALTDFDYFGYPGNFLALPAGTFMPFSMTRTFSGLPAGTYDVGLCGCIDGTDAWVTDWTWVNVQVFQQ